MSKLVSLIERKRCNVYVNGRDVSYREFFDNIIKCTFEFQIQYLNLVKPSSPIFIEINAIYL